MFIWIEEQLLLISGFYRVHFSFNFCRQPRYPTFFTTAHFECDRQRTATSFCTVSCSSSVICFYQYSRSDSFTLNRIQQRQRQLYVLRFSPLFILRVIGNVLPLRFIQWEILLVRWISTNIVDLIYLNWIGFNNSKGNYTSYLFHHCLFWAWQAVYCHFVLDIDRLLLL